MDLKERFTKAIELIVGEQPPHSFVNQWLENNPIDGNYRLQEWILNQKQTPTWCQGIILLEAAMYIAKNPVEGMFHGI